MTVFSMRIFLQIIKNQLKVYMWTPHLGFAKSLYYSLYLISDGDRKLYFPGYYFLADRRLKNHKIKTVLVQDSDFCELLCYQHDDCVSVNIKKDRDSATGQQECELSNSTHLEHEGDLTNDKSYLYRGAKVITLPNNCSLKFLPSFVK